MKVTVDFQPDQNELTMNNLQAAKTGDIEFLNQSFDRVCQELTKIFIFNEEDFRKQVMMINPESKPIPQNS
jgi:hypothetical protein